MRPFILNMARKRGAFKYDDYDIEARLGPRELRPMAYHKNKNILYEGEWRRNWRRNSNMPEGRCIILYRNPPVLYEGYFLNG